MANKMIKRKVIGMMMNEEIVKANAVYMGYLQNELALLDKKASNKKATANQKANEGIKDTILAVLAEIGSGTVTAMQSANAELGALSNQKVSSLVKQLVDAELVVKTVDKKVSTFSLKADTAEVEGEGE